MVVPDFSVKLGSGIPKRTTGQAVDIQSVHPPDLIFEIVSPKTFPYMTEIKRLAYAAAGVPEYAIIDPAARTLRLYALAAPRRYQGPREFGAGQSMSFACLPGISLEVGKLFEGAPDTTL